MNTLAEHINKDYLMYAIWCTLLLSGYCLGRFDDHNILVPQAGRICGWIAWAVTIILLAIHISIFGFSIKQ